ncbi:Secretory lipase [Knoellia sinensis KCTC 19936]|uniref:Secretory lipase n=2 Tax=Knoellia TaxID=136099 RepID=A0A0A0J477_9MICO|nr:Secretory lipase [Knoellia sinensis KCTC 19936]
MFRRAFVPIVALGLTAAIAAPASAGPDNVPGTAGATTVTGVAEPARPAFYEPPANLPVASGAVIRTEPATQFLDPLGLSSLSVSATRMMYASKDRLGRPIAVTGTVFEPKAGYVGLSARPLISFASGTMGIGDKCAPSRGLAEGLTMYEILFIQGLINRGYAVAFTDYQGLGTPGTHTYMNRVVQGQAVLDMARAALKRSGTTLTASTPVGIYGYSQGGGAAASAAELASTYAPELKVKGTVAGAVPADLAAVVKNLDGSVYSEFLNFALLGLASGYGIDMDDYLNDAGTQVAVATENHCTVDLPKAAFQDSSKLTLNGQSVLSYLTVEPFKSIVAENRIGRIKPSAPVLVSHSLLDDAIPYAVGRQLAKDWCGKGGNIRLTTNVGPTHIGGALPSSSDSYAFFEARFAGLPQLSNCWTIW